MKCIISFIVMLSLCPMVTGQEKSERKDAAGTTAPKPKPAASSPKEAEVAEGPTGKEGPRAAAVSSMDTGELEGFDHYAPQVRQLIRDALALTKMNLTYRFGSSDPKQGGMDCSGTIHHLLKEHGFKDVPRQSNEMCGWVQDRTLLHRIVEADSLKHPEFAALQPGDLLFWSGTYETGPRNIPVTHVMLYLGKMKKTGRPLMFGASDGRVYQGEKRTGVSVFDFNLPKESSPSKFYGYGMIPGVGRIVHKAPVDTPAKPASPTAMEKVTGAPVAAVPPQPAAPATKGKDITPKATVTAPKTVSPDPGETIKRAIVVNPDKPATASPAPKNTSTSTSTQARKSTSTAAKARPKTTSTAGKKATPSSSRGTTSGTDMETRMRQKAREVSDSIKNILSR